MGILHVSSLCTGCTDNTDQSFSSTGMNASNVAGGLGCLVEGYDSATHMCQTEVARSVKLALSIYVPESSVTRVRLEHAPFTVFIYEHPLLIRLCSGYE